MIKSNLLTKPNKVIIKTKNSKKDNEIMKKIKEIIKEQKQIKKEQKEAYWSIYKRKEILKWMRIILKYSNHKSPTPNDVSFKVTREELYIIRYIFVNKLLTSEEPLENFVQKSLDIINEALKEVAQQKHIEYKIKDKKKLKEVGSFFIVDNKNGTFEVIVINDQTTITEKGIKYKNEIKEYWTNFIISSLIPALSLIIAIIAIALKIK